MNRDWLKRNGIALVFLVGFVVFLAYDIWKLQQAIRHRRSVEEELEREEQRLQELLRSEIFPSSENVRILRSNREQLEGLYSQIVHRVARPVPAPTLNRVQFRALLTQKLNELSDTAREKGVVLGANFAFGFDEYLGTLPPDNRAVLN
ncbi:MAG: Amuc_1100 family pilus-like protein, partial [Verrucomicrobiae bacterium]|nr:Amuc_1100 family pilus-like protein [Verrucomicrobiae bacterium]